MTFLPRIPVHQNGAKTQSFVPCPIRVFGCGGFFHREFRRAKLRRERMAGFVLCHICSGRLKHVVVTSAKSRVEPGPRTKLRFRKFELRPLTYTPSARDRATRQPRRPRNSKRWFRRPMRRCSLGSFRKLGGAIWQDFKFVKFRGRRLPFRGRPWFAMKPT